MVSAAAVLVTICPRVEGATTKHVGLVTDICRFEGSVYSLSTAGLVEGMGEQAKVVFRPEQRWIAMAPFRWNGRRALMVVGGEPGVSGLVSVYEPGAGVRHVEKLADDLLYDVAVSPNGQCAIGAADGRVFLRAENKESFANLPVQHKHTAAVRSVVFSPDGHYLASAGLDGLVLLSNVESAESPLALQDHSEKVECVAFSADSRWVYSGARDGRVRVHAASDGRLVRTYTELGGVPPGEPWDQSNQVLFVASYADPERMLAATSLGYVVSLSLETTESHLLQRLSGPINSLLVGGDSFLVGADAVRRFEFSARGR